jgi:hypothetical protein
MEKFRGLVSPGNDSYMDLQSFIETTGMDQRCIVKGLGIDVNNGIH